MEDIVFPVLFYAAEWLLLSGGFVHCFQQKTYRAEAVVATDECRMRIFHPAVIKIAASGSQFFDKPFHGFPCALAKISGFFTIDAYP